MSEVGQRATELQEQYSKELDGFVDERIPTTLANEEYFARLAALLVAQNRSLARLSATFAAQTQKPLKDVWQENAVQLGNNMELCHAVLAGGGQTVQ